MHTVFKIKVSLNFKVTHIQAQIKALKSACITSIAKTWEERREGRNQ